MKARLGFPAGFWTSHQWRSLFSFPRPLRYHLFPVLLCQINSHWRFNFLLAEMLEERDFCQDVTMGPMKPVLENGIIISWKKNDGGLFEVGFICQFSCAWIGCWRLTTLWDWSFLNSNTAQGVSLCHQIQVTPPTFLPQLARISKV